jgi:hypothetical protein
MNEKYAALRANVGMLGQLLGKSIKDHQGQAFLDKIETIRQLAKSSRKGNEADRERLLDTLKSLYWVEDANDLFKRLPAYKEKCFRGTFGAVLIPYFSELEDGAMLMYAQLRFIDDDAPGRYMTLEIGGGRKVWGLDRLDLDEDIYVFEGAFDAMFLPNAIAAGGADLLDTVEWLRTKAKSKISIV